jgi:homospermidine synthase
MNPGLITHFARIGILKAAKWAMLHAKIDKKALQSAIVARNWARMAYILKLRTAHCSEVDTQISAHRRKPDEFMNTWSCIGFYEEGVDPMQIGWGSHESSKHDGQRTSDNQVSFHIRGIDKKHESYVPKYGKIKGYLVSHSENDTLSASLRYGSYQPSAYYVYLPCKDAIASIDAVKKKKYHELDKIWSMRSDVTSGYDAVGSLLIFDKHGPLKGKTLWSGTILNVKQVRKLGIKYSGPTSVQVAISLFAVIDWMKSHPDKGLMFPEDLPSEHIIKFCKRYLGNVVCKFTSYKDKNNGKFNPC